MDTNALIHPYLGGLPCWLKRSRICLQCGRPGFSLWVGKIPWRRAWKPTPVFLPGEFHRLGGLQSTGSDMTLRLTLSLFTRTWEGVPGGVFLRLRESRDTLPAGIPAHPPVVLSGSQPSLPAQEFSFGLFRGLFKAQPQQVPAAPCLRLRLHACVSARQNSHCISPAFSASLRCTPVLPPRPASCGSAQLSLPDLILPTQILLIPWEAWKMSPEYSRLDWKWQMAVPSLSVFLEPSARDNTLSALVSIGHRECLLCSVYQ